MVLGAFYYAVATFQQAVVHEPDDNGESGSEDEDGKTVVSMQFGELREQTIQMS